MTDHQRALIELLMARFNVQGAEIEALREAVAALKKSHKAIEQVIRLALKNTQK